MSPSITPATSCPINEDRMIEACAVGTHVERSAFYFTSQNEPLFAWLHRAADSACHSQGVVICAPIGAEQIHSHRALRHLADALAQQGFPVLRFDYHGTGDSSGTDEDGQRLATWVANIRDAADWMRNQLGCQDVSLAGLRFGATLATLVAQELPVENLILWSPVIQGKRYIREIKAVARMANGASFAPSGSDQEITAAGFVMTKETADSISQIDLLRASPHCQRVLIIERDDTACDTRLQDSLLAKKIDVDQSTKPSYLEMMAEPHFTRVPQAAIDQITSWLADKLPQVPAFEHQFQRVPTASISANIGASLEEQACRIHDDPHLFGVLTQPVGTQTSSLPLVVLLNAGACHHVGPARLHVQIARALGELGFRSLRIDACGLGDSVLSNAQNENDTYAATIFRDIDITLNYAHRHLAADQVVLMGLCSGAYAAFQSAARLSSPVLVESVLINPLTFFWQDGMSLEAAVPNQVNAWHYYLQAMLDPRKWLKLISGKTEAGLVGAIQRFLHRVVPTGKAPLAKNACHRDFSVPVEYSHPERDDLRADLDRVVRARRQLAMFISDSDPGHFLLMFHARRKANQLIRAGRLSCEFIERADHTFSNPVARQTFIDKLANYLCRRYREKG